VAVLASHSLQVVLERLVEHFEEVSDGGCQVLRGVARIVLQGRLVTLDSLDFESEDES